MLVVVVFEGLKGNHVSPFFIFWNQNAQGIVYILDSNHTLHIFEREE